MEHVEQPRAASDDEPGVEVIACVWCGSDEVERIAEYGPGLMTEQYMCLRCRSPFEVIRKRG